MVVLAGSTRKAASISATVFGGVRRGRSAMPCRPRGAEMLAQELTGHGIEQPGNIVPLHVDATCRPSQVGRRS